MLEILKYPDPRLRLLCKPIAKVTNELADFAKSMLITMYESRGIGLAAAQVNRQIRLVVIDTRSKAERDSEKNDSEANPQGKELKKTKSKSLGSSKASIKSQDIEASKDDRYDLSSMTELEKQIEQPLVLFNPEIVNKKGKTTFDEGCLSVPTFFETVERFDYVEVKALDINGKEIFLKTDGLLSICIQHEIDHLDGKLFIDRLSTIKGNRIKNKIKKSGYPDASDDSENADHNL